MEPARVPPEGRPHGWQYVAGVAFILALAGIAWVMYGR
jgi:hypothetical protein